MLRPFHALYAANGMRANAFLPRGFGEAADRRARVAAASERRVAPELHALLREQNEALPASEARRAHLQALSEPGTAVVVTGQQVGLFLGPLYTVYKAASAIAVAKALTAETGVRCVPLFWLQTEDHDFAEIATCVTPVDHGPPVHLTLADDSALARRSLADRTLGADVRDLTEQLQTALQDKPFGSEVIELLRTHYRPGIAPGRAFAAVLAALFEEDGLLVFDPRNATAARLAAPVIRTALLEVPRLEAVLAKRGRELADAGFAEQIPLRPGTSLAFVHQHGAQGPRHRPSLRDGRYALPGNGELLGESELLSMLEREPLRFSTSALLRPIVQDTLLPTAAYVGGPAEVSYFAQVAALCAAFGMEPPLVAERAHFRLLTPRLRSLLEKLGLSSTDLEQPTDVLVKKLARAPNSESQPGPQWLSELEQRLDSLAASDPGLVRAIERTRGSVRHAVGRLARRHQQAVLDRDQTLTDRLTRLQAWLRPDGAPQERVHSFPAFAAKVGLTAFREAIMAAVDPFNPKLREIDL